jgi:hypothetical protein
LQTTLYQNIEKRVQSKEEAVNELREEELATAEGVDAEPAQQVQHTMVLPIDH